MVCSAVLESVVLVRFVISLGFASWNYKPYSCNSFPNCTTNHAITYTNNITVFRNYWNSTIQEQNGTDPE